MTHTPDFDELVGADLPAAERERLSRIHHLLVAAGPPPELSPEIESGPTLAMSLARGPKKRVFQRRVALLAAAIAVIALAFLGGYLAGNRGGGLASAHVLHLQGTRLAPQAVADLRIEPVDSSGNWPMRFSATGLPKLAPRSYYEVFLVRHGRLFAPCGRFVSRGTDAGISVPLNAPYRLEKGDSWVVTRQRANAPEGSGGIVMRPTV